MSFDSRLSQQVGYRLFRKTRLGVIPKASFSGSRYLLAAGLFMFTALSVAIPAVSQNVQFLPNTTLVAGTGTKSYTGDGGPALSATFATAAESVTMDPFGNIYVADSGNNAIRRIDSATGVITTYAGGLATVCAAATDAYGNGCPATQSVLKTPNGVRYYKGDIYIADSANNEIRKVSGASGIITAFAGNGSIGTSVAGGTATTTIVNSPQDVTFDPSGNAFIATGGGKPFILRVDAVTTNVAIVAGTGVAGNTGDGGLATAAQIQTPIGLALDPQGNVYFTCSTPNNIREVTIPAGATTGIISTYVGTSGVSVAGFSGDGGPASLAELHTPQHIAFDALGNLYLVDQANHRVRMVSPLSAGSIINTIAGTGIGGNTPTGGVSINSNLNQPRGLDLTPAGDLVVTDGFNAEIKVLGPPVKAASAAVGATVTYNAAALVNTALTLGSYAVPAGYTSFTSGTVTGCTAGAAVSAATICTVPLTFQPKAVGITGAPLQFSDNSGNVYTLPLAGLGNAPAAAVLPGIVGAVAGTGTAGNSGDNSAAMAAKLNKPLAIAVDSLGNYYIADSANNEVRKVAASTGIITRIAGTGAAGFSGDGGAANLAMLNAPSGLAVDGAGTLYIADTGNNRIRKISAGVITTFAGTGTAGYSGDGGPIALAQLSAPQGLYLSPIGVLYIADAGNNVIRMIGLRSSYINTIAGTGKAGYTGDTAESATATLKAPTAVALDNSGNIYIADTGNNVIRRVSYANGVITTYAGSGTVGFSNGAAATASFSAPSALTVDAAVNVYVADTGNNAIRLITGGQVVTAAGTGTAGLTGNGGIATNATFNAPMGLALDNNGNILIADTGNNLIRNINVASSSVAFPITNPGSSASQSLSLINSGNLPLAITSVALPANYTEQASGSTDCNSAALSIASGAACAANIVFAPTALQSYPGTVVITDNAQNQTAVTQNIAVSGVGAYVFTAAITVPSSTVAGVSQSITVKVTNPQAIYTGTVHFISSDAKAILPADYTFTIADNGTHVFTGVQLKTAAIETITVTDTTNSTITATGLVTVVGGPPAALTIVSGNGQSADISKSYTLPLAVMVTDSLGNPSTGAPVNFIAPTSGADASFGATKASTYAGISNSLGLVTTPLLFPDGVVGTFAIAAAITGITPVSFNLTNTSTVPEGFTMSSYPSSIVSLPPGTSATVIVSITPSGGFNAPVNVSCAGAVPTTTCTLSATTIAPSGTGAPTNFSLTVATKGPASSAKLRGMRTPVFACLLLLVLGSGLRNRRKLQGAILALAACIAMMGISGCGSGPNTTLPGVYSLTVLGTSGTITSSVVIDYYVAGAP